MRISRKHLVAAAVAMAALMVGPVADAKTPSGWNKGSKTWKGGTPPGFSHGKKTGWDKVSGTTLRLPPGLMR